METLFIYYVRTAQLDSPIVKAKIVENMAQNTQAAFLSTYDKIKIEGKIEGKIEQAIIFAEKLIAEFPAMTDERISALSGASLEIVKRLRQKPTSKGEQ